MKFLKVSGVILAALVITTLGISASDTFSGNSDSLLGAVIGTGDESRCPAGMTEVFTSQSFTCVDTYEASSAEACEFANPRSVQETQKNLNNLECAAESKTNASPWTHVTRSQAQSLCARAGKRLPTSEEWYSFAAGTIDSAEACNLDNTGVSPVGSYEDCRSGAGVYDAVGNVWEWTADDVFEGNLNERALPEEGYVTQVDAQGVATMTDGKPSDEFGSDYFWQDSSGTYGLLRGGFFASGEDAGVYAVHAKTKPTAATQAIGFRCVR